MCCQSDVFLICSCLVYLHVFSVVEYVELSGPPYKFLTTVIYGHWDHLFTKRPYPWLQQDSREGEKSPTPSLFPSIPSFLPETAQHSWSLPPLTIPPFVSHSLSHLLFCRGGTSKTNSRQSVGGRTQGTAIHRDLPASPRTQQMFWTLDPTWFNLLQIVHLHLKHACCSEFTVSHKT